MNCPQIASCPHPIDFGADKMQFADNSLEFGEDKTQFADNLLEFGVGKKRNLRTIR